MSDIPATPPAAPPPGQPGPAGYEQYPAQESGSPNRSRKPLLVAGVAVACLAVAGGAYAATRGLGGAGAQPADVLPVDAMAYARVDLDPRSARRWPPSG